MICRKQCLRGDDFELLMLAFVIYGVSSLVEYMYYHYLFYVDSHDALAFEGSPDCS